VVDLEDALHPSAKEAARALLRRVWPAIGGHKLLRVNGADTPWHADDLALAEELKPDGVVLPKVEDPWQVPLVGAPVFLMVETARGVLAAASLARVDGVAGLVLGGADLRRSLHASPLPDEAELLAARGAVVLAARAAGIAAYDTPWFNVADAVGLEASARRARALGFDGKTAIHPGQLDVIHAAFTPTAEEVERARRVIAAIEEAGAKGLGVATVDGEMVEALHADEARRVLARLR
jgi:citrate lyase beta subunit